MLNYDNYEHAITEEKKKHFFLHWNDIYRTANPETSKALISMLF